MAVSLRAFVSALIGLALAVSIASAQQSSAPIASMSSTEILSAAASADAAARVQLAKRAAELLKAGDVVTEGDYASLVALFKLAQSELAPSDKFQLAKQLGERNDGATLSYQAMRQKFALMYLAGVPLSQRAAEVAAWIESDQTGFADVLEAEYAWLYNALAEPHLKHGSFSVEWSGRMSAPRTGEYVLSISPINVNATWEKFYIRSYWAISVAGQEVLKSSPDSWVTESAPVQLTANQPVDISVAASFEVSRPAIDAIHAMLFWKGPGSARQIVPEAALSTADGQPGLNAKYSVTLVDGAKVVERVDPTIDFAWTTDRRVVAGHERAMKKLREQIWKVCMSPEYLAGCEEAASPRHRHPFLYDLLLVECLTSPQREAFLVELQNRPAMLERLTPTEAIRFFRAFRFGVEEAAIDAWGQWAVMHADFQSELPATPDSQAYFDGNRLEFHDLARNVCQQCPSHVETLKEEYLVRDDGGCVLPVAYVLTYCHQDSGRMTQWIDFLDERLADPKIVGDVRVNWLLVRSMADEMRGLEPSFFNGGNENLAAGWLWLAEADRAAASPEAKTRVVQEWVGRETAMGYFDGAQARVRKALSELPGEQAKLAALQSKVDKLSNFRAERVKAAETAGLEGYVQEMQRRQQIAADSGDDQEAARIGRLIEAVDQTE